MYRKVAAWNAILLSPLTARNRQIRYKSVFVVDKHNPVRNAPSRRRDVIRNDRIGGTGSCSNNRDSVCDIVPPTRISPRTDAHGLPVNGYGRQRIRQRCSGGRGGRIWRNGILGRGIHVDYRMESMNRSLLCHCSADIGTRSCYRNIVQTDLSVCVRNGCIMLCHCRFRCDSGAPVAEIPCIREIARGSSVSPCRECNCAGHNTSFVLNGKVEHNLILINCISDNNSSRSTISGNRMRISTATAATGTVPARCRWD